MGKKSNNGYHVPDMDKYAPTSWGEESETGEPFDYKTASGQLCLIRKIGMEEILRLGLFDKVDFFSKSLTEDEKKAKAAADKAKQDDGASFAKTVMSNFDQLDETVNKVLVHGVIAPVLTPAPENGIHDPEWKKKGIVYVDKIRFEDRIELFDQILDMDGLSSFREESSDGVGTVPSDETLQDAPV